jgi:hypothetical protein
MLRVSAIRRCRAVVLLGLIASIVTSRATAQDLKPQQINTPDDGDHALVLELGSAGDWSHAEGFHPGGTFAFEITPIENWLELEIGFTAIRADASTEMPIDILTDLQKYGLQRRTCGCSNGRRQRCPAIPIRDRTTRGIAMTSRETSRCIGSSSDVGRRPTVNRKTTPAIAVTMGAIEGAITIRATWSRSARRVPGRA